MREEVKNVADKLVADMTKLVDLIEELSKIDPDAALLEIEEAKELFASVKETILKGETA